MKDWVGVASRNYDKPPRSSHLFETDYIFVRLNILREYLERELLMPNLPFKYEFDRVLDDWGWLTDIDDVNLERVQLIMLELLAQQKSVVNARQEAYNIRKAGMSTDAQAGRTNKAALECDVRTCQIY
ncbi:hypothetical protein NQ317_001766 [Molorchus minor]|uniref:Uncharacterized protein n=1 Tax=Molorchus minor TaxID=1323400 RepID=A0ABQ9JIN5_9CUCU|nr:hypothetical protein NQ317_001766 [Molorchus minor]